MSNLVDRNVHFLDRNYYAILNESTYAKQSEDKGRENLNRTGGFLIEKIKLDEQINEKNKECNSHGFLQNMFMGLALILTVIQLIFVGSLLVKSRIKKPEVKVKQKDKKSANNFLKWWKESHYHTNFFVGLFSGIVSALLVEKGIRKSLIPCIENISCFIKTLLPIALISIILIIILIVVYFVCAIIIYEWEKR